MNIRIAGFVDDFFHNGMFVRSGELYYAVNMKFGDFGLGEVVVVEGTLRDFAHDGGAIWGIINATRARKIELP